MNLFVLPSTFLLTLLLMVGLFFFVRASVKDRIQQVQLVAVQSEGLVLDRMDAYLTRRAYRLTDLDREQGQVTFEGMVRPSVVLAIFLMLLVALALLCMGLVLSLLFPAIGLRFTSLMILTPLVGWFYWRKAQRLEKVCFKVESLSSEGQEDVTDKPQTLLTITAHRDELAVLKATLPFQQAEGFV